MFRIVASLGASLFAETLQQRVLANVRMSYTQALYVFNVQSDALNHVLCSLNKGLLNFMTSSPVVTGLTHYYSSFNLTVTVKVQLLVPEFTETHLLPYLLTIPLCGQ